jgi:hypothetical protein
VVHSQVYFIRRAKGTYTPDVKAFHQGTNDYIVVGLERTKVTQPCGVLFFDVTNPGNPVMGAQFIGSDWCDVHNVFVEATNPITGDGRYVYVTADNTNDLRVLDISNVANPTEVGRYTASGANTSNYVHDVTVVDHGGLAGRRVYLSYWDSGLVILNAADLTATPLVAPNVIDPGGFLTHHAVPSADGSLVFFQDEFLGAPGEPQTGEPVQMWTLDSLATCSNVGDSPPCYIDGLALGSDVAVNPAHNLEIRYDIDATRLYVGWYKLGLRAWDFSAAGFDRVAGMPSSAIYHQVQTEPTDQPYSGTWGVRLEEITVGGAENTYIFQSDRNFGLIVDCIGCSVPVATFGTIQGIVTRSDGGTVIAGASVMTETGQNATTDVNGAYTLSSVPTGSRTVTASADGYVDQSAPVSVTDGGTSTQNFVLDPSVTSGGFGTIKGTVTDSISGARLNGVSLETDTGETATTNRRGKYTLRNVPAGDRTVTANETGYVFYESAPISVTAGQTSTLNFPLAPQ